MPGKRNITKADSGTSTFVPPYPPSWFDRFKAWVDRLPGPAWAFYLVLAVAVVLVETAIQWREGAFPVGTFSRLQVWNVGSFAYLLGLMHFLDKTAASSIAAFRPLLTIAKSGRRPSVEDQSRFGELSYRLTTLPSRPALLATIAGAIAPVFALLQIRSGTVPTPFAETALTTLSTASVMAAFIPANALGFLNGLPFGPSVGAGQPDLYGPRPHQRLPAATALRPIAPWGVHRARRDRLHLHLALCLSSRGPITVPNRHRVLSGIRRDWRSRIRPALAGGSSPPHRRERSPSGGVNVPL